MNYEVESGGSRRSVRVRRGPSGGWVVAVDDGPEQQIGGARVGAAEWHVDLDGVRRTRGAARHGEYVHVVIDGHPLRAKVQDPRKDALALGKAGAAGAVITEMPGAVVRVLVAVGDTVAAGEPVIVVEAMKMENELKAPIAGTVAEIPFAAGERVESGALLLVIEPEEG